MRMVVKDTLPMANILDSVESCEPHVHTGCSISLSDDCTVKAGRPVRQSASSSSVNIDDENTKGKSVGVSPITGCSLRIMTTLHNGHLSSSTKTFSCSTDGGRSEDDDGYCSRSSLDSPVQSLKQDNAALGGDDSDVFKLKLDNQQSGACDESTENNNITVSDTGMMKGESCALDYNEKTAVPVAVMPFDHTYLPAESDAVSCEKTAAVATESHSTTEVAVDSAENVDTQPQVMLDKSTVQPLATLFGVAKGIAGNRRNISVYVVPRMVQSVAAANFRETGLLQVAPVVNACEQRVDQAKVVSHGSWNGQSNIVDGVKNGTVLRFSAANKATVGRTGNLSWRISEQPLQSSAVNSIIYTTDGNFQSSLRPSAASIHRPDQYKPGVSTGRCRLGLSETAKRSPLTISLTQQRNCTSARTGSTYVRSVQTVVRSSQVNRASHGSNLGLHLHPLVDHDYGAFATFNAEVQSSIIATTTDGATQLDWRNVRKSRLGRARSQNVEMSIVMPDSTTANVVDVTSSEFQVRQKRKYCRRQPLLRNAVAYVPKPAKPGRPAGRKGRPPASESRRLAAARKRQECLDTDILVSSETDDSQNFVKIPGCYQDEFVYYATKRARGRPRKQPDMVNAVPIPKTLESSKAASKQTAPVGGVNVFDWYREMADTDKSSRFGTADRSEPSNLLASSSSWTAVGSQLSADSCTPADESAIADLVMEMLPKADIGPGYQPVSSGSSEFVTTPTIFSTAGDPSDITVTEEDVCAAMLQSLNEADLKMIEKQLVGSNILADRSSVEDKPFVQFVDGLVSLSQTAAVPPTSGLLDVDEINDSDLLTADLGNMNALLSDLDTPSRDVRMSNIPATSRSNLSAIFDETGLGSGINTMATVAPSARAVSDQAAILSAPPELVTVNMFWNDLPGLRIGGKEYVRLVDIHRQILTAKDTGILKKRCQMLDIGICQCSELQRDFLIRYMNAAKSKSTVIVSRDNAIELIGFYVNPKSKGMREDLVSSPGMRVGTTLSKAVDAHLPKITDMEKKPKDTAASAWSLTTTSVMPTTPLPSSQRAGDSTSVKRSERLRDKHVRYADMVLGNYQRTYSESVVDTVTVHHTHDAGERLKRPASMNVVVLPAKRRSFSCNGELESSTVKPAAVKQVDAAARAERVICHSHRTRLASASEAVTSVQPGEICASSNQGLAKVHNAQPSSPAATLSSSSSAAVATSSPPVSVSSAHNRTSQFHQEQVNRKQAVNEQLRLRRLHRGNRVAPWRRRRSSLPGKTSRESVASFTCSGSTVCENYTDNSSGVDHNLRVEQTITVSSCASDNVVTTFKADADEQCERFNGTSDAEHVAADSCNSVETDVYADKLGDQSKDHTDDSCLESAVKLENMDEDPQPACRFIEVMHCDVIRRVGRRQLVQCGTVLLDNFISSDAECVRCGTCQQMFSVELFLNHLHLTSNPNELVQVTGSRRLVPRESVSKEWLEFQRLQALYLSTNNQSTGHSLLVDNAVNQSVVDKCDVESLLKPEMCENNEENIEQHKVNGESPSPCSRQKEFLPIVERSPRRITRAVDSSCKDEKSHERDVNTSLSSLSFTTQSSGETNGPSRRCMRSNAAVSELSVSPKAEVTVAQSPTQIPVQRKIPRRLSAAPSDTEPVSRNTRGHSNQRGYSLRSPPRPVLNRIAASR